LSYRSLHILLLVVLLVLDIVMVNVSGVVAFWLRCRTAVFDTPELASADLSKDTIPWIGLADRVRYRFDRDSEWYSLSYPAPSKRVIDPVLEVEFDTPSVIESIAFAVPDSAANLSVIQAYDRDNGSVTAVLSYLASGRLQASGFQKPITRVEITIGRSDGALGDIEVRGYDPHRLALFAAPVTKTPEGPYWYLLGVWNAAALFGLLFSGAYRITRSLEILDDLSLVMKAVGSASVAVIVILFLYRGYQEATYWGFEYSRLVVIFGALFSTVLLTGNRAIIDAVHSAFLRRGFGIRRVIVVGAGPLGQGIVDRLRKHYWLAYEPVAFVDDNPYTHGTDVLGLPVAGGTDVLQEVARSARTNEVIVALPNSSHKTIRDIVGRCKSESFNFHILPDLFDVISGDVRVGAIDGVPVLDLEDHYLGEWDRFLKRGLDITAVLIGGVLLLPVWILFAGLIKLTSHGPVLYRQSRVGENGKTFSCFKFRTMQIASSDEESTERKELYADLIDGNSDGGKIINGNRVTWVGSILRKYRLDELPQILNVLLGEMSLVGPRPPIPYEVEHYNSWHMERLKGTPGITGLWQVSGGPVLSFEEMVKLDIFYLKSWSLWLDFKILVKTIPVVLSGKGA
jgi:exopolysaccharide biosynthesis polyprenyl glycosylphosphotransferase